MKIPKYEDCEHVDQGYWRSGGSYAIDWEKGERKYRIPYPGIRVYEHGEVLIAGNGYRDPVWRIKVESRFGLRFRLLRDITHAKFYSPEGEPVRKQEIGGGVFLQEGDRIYSCRHDAPLSLYYDTAQLSPEQYVCYARRNLEKEKARLIQLEEYFALGDTLVAMKGTLGYFLTLEPRETLTKGRYPKDLESPETQEFCHAISSHKKETIDLIIDKCKDEYEKPYLIVER